MDSSQRSPANGLSRRVVDWGAVGGLVFEWVIAIGEYVVTVLVVALVGGMLGQFADVGLSLVGETWVGQGRTWGWMLGAVSAAIGLPLGWVRRDGKKFSFPSPRALRKKVASGISERRKKKRTSHEFRTVGDVLKNVGAAGLVGAILGFLLGGALAICWFSLAMSPFARAGWFESLDFRSRRPEAHDRISRRRDEPGGMTVRTKSPAVVYLWFGPVLLLGAGGAAAGTMYGAAQYFRYVTTVPAEVRARQRAKKRQPVVDEREAAAAAIEQKLPVLASPPRRVPLRARWQLLRGGLGLGLALGVFFFVVGAIFAGLLALGVEIEGEQGYFVAFLLAVVFLAVGSTASIACWRTWMRKIAILRRGYLARCQIVECKDEQANRWKPYETFIEELRAVWDKPIAEVVEEVTTERKLNVLGAVWEKTTKDRDTKSFQRFATFAGCFAMLVLGFMGSVGVVMTFGMLYFAVVEREAIGWFGLLFMAIWWAVIVWMGRMFLQRVQLFKNIDKRSLRSSGIEPEFKCRIQFSLPDGKTVKLETKLDLSRELAGSDAEQEELAVYDAMDPKRALLCRQFRPPLRVGEAGEWKLA